MKKKLSSEKNNLNVVMAIFGVVIGVLAAVLIVLILNDGGKEARPTTEPTIDETSGEMMWEIDEEPEAGGELVVVGFHNLSDFGFMATQYNKIVATVKEYIVSEHPEYKQISYVKDSFKYVGEGREKSSFLFVGNIWDRYKVNLDTHGELWDIEVKIERE